MGVNKVLLEKPQIFMEVFTLCDTSYKLERMYTKEDSVKVGIFNEFTIDLTDIFKEDFS